MTLIVTCGCICHLDGMTRHVVPCCLVCPDRGATVTFGAFEQHEREHAPKCDDQATLEDVTGERRTP
jgi:hypothetical protein